MFLIYGFQLSYNKPFQTGVRGQKIMFIEKILIKSISIYQLSYMTVLIKIVTNEAVQTAWHIIYIR